MACYVRFGKGGLLFKVGKAGCVSLGKVSFYVKFRKGDLLCKVWERWLVM